MSYIGFSIIFSILTNILPNQKEMTKIHIQEKDNVYTEWILSSMIRDQHLGVSIKGKPGISKCKYGDAVVFDGSTDAVFIDEMPLSGLEQFTVEMIFNPSIGGNFEQRFLHCGEPQGDRVLLELRSTESDWYFDGFIKVADQNCALINPELLHPLNKWYHVAYVIDNGKIATYVNSKIELEGQIIMTLVKGNVTSIGVRQNEVSWFKGAIYKIRVTPKALMPSDFMSF